MAIRDLVKGELNWHTKINANFKEMEQNIADKMDILDSKEEIEANTESGKSAGALGVKEMVNELSNDLVSDIYVGDDGKLHKVQGGADTVLPFSSGNAIYLGMGTSFDIKEIYPDWANLTADNFIYGCKTVIASSNSNGKLPTAGNISVSRNVTANYSNGVLKINSVSGQSIDASTTRDVSVSAGNYFAFLLLPT